MVADLPLARAVFIDTSRIGLPKNLDHDNMIEMRKRFALDDLMQKVLTPLLTDGRKWTIEFRDDWEKRELTDATTSYTRNAIIALADGVECKVGEWAWNVHGIVVNGDVGTLYNVGPAVPIANDVKPIFLNWVFHRRAGLWERVT